MATSTRKDFFIAEVLDDAVQATFAEGITALWGSAGVIMNSSFPGGVNNVGESVKVPYFGNIGEWEDVPEGAALTPTKLTSDVEQSIVIHTGKAFGITDWARFAAAGGDPYAEAAKQIKEGFVRRIDRGLIDSLITPPIPSDMIVDAYNAATPRTLDYDMVVDGKLKWGDEESQIALMLTHSKVKGDAYKLRDALGRPMLTDIKEGGMSKFLGIDIGVSDRLAPTPQHGNAPARYSTFLVQPRSLVCWYNGQPTVESGRDILTGADVVAVHAYFVIHRYRHLNGRRKGGVAELRHN